MTGIHIGGKRGFSLPELMVVIVIGAIGAAVALPSFVELLRDSQSESAAEEVAASMRGARAKSISQGNAFVWSYDAVSRVYEAFDDDNGNGIADAGETTYGPAPLPSCIELEASTIPGNELTFGPLGNANVSGELTFSDNHGAVIAVTVEAATGKISVGNRRPGGGS